MLLSNLRFLMLSNDERSHFDCKNLNLEKCILRGGEASSCRRQFLLLLRLARTFDAVDVCDGGLTPLEVCLCFLFFLW